MSQSRGNLYVIMIHKSICSSPICIHGVSILLNHITVEHPLTDTPHNRQPLYNRHYICLSQLHTTVHKLKSLSL